MVHFRTLATIVRLNRVFDNPSMFHMYLYNISSHPFLSKNNNTARQRRLRRRHATITIVWLQHERSLFTRHGGDRLNLSWNRGPRGALSPPTPTDHRWNYNKLTNAVHTLYTTIYRATSVGTRLFAEVNMYTLYTRILWV